MSNIRRSVGMKLKNLIDTKGISQSELAKETGVSQPTISSMLPGMDDAKQYPATSYENILALAKFFNVSVDWLLGNSDYRSTLQSVKVAAKTTGLSDAAIQSLKKWKEYNTSPLKQYLVPKEKPLSIIEALLCTEKGNQLLGLIQDYISSDFSKFFLEDDNGDLMPYNHPVVIRHMDGSNSYADPEALERVEIDRITNAIKLFKDSAHEKWIE